jgi:hypothetical protein
MDPEELFHLDFVVGEPIPDVPVACDVQQSIYLLRPHRLAFFGHMLRDNFHHIATNLAALGRADVDHDLLIWRTSTNQESSDLHVPGKYARYIAKDLRTFEDVTATCSKAPSSAPRSQLGTPVSTLCVRSVTQWETCSWTRTLNALSHNLTAYTCLCMLVKEIMLCPPAGMFTRSVAPKVSEHLMLDPHLLCSSYWPGTSAAGWVLQNIAAWVE